MRYTVICVDTVTEWTTVEADSPEEAAYAAEPPSTCHQCPECSGAPSVIVTDETGAKVYDDTPRKMRADEIKRLRAMLEAAGIDWRTK